jgi:hypothetical protein
MLSRLFLILFFVITTVFTAHSSSPLRQDFNNSKSPELVKDFPEITNISTEEFLNLSPKEYEKLTGKHLAFKDRLKLKLTQKMLKNKLRKGESNLPKVAYVLLSIFGFGFLAMGILDNWTGNNWWIALLLSFLFWLPGVIFALIKMSGYY